MILPIRLSSARFGVLEKKPENQVRAAGTRDRDFLGISREKGKAGALGKPG
jgi:hypothetical protein